MTVRWGSAALQPAPVVSKVRWGTAQLGGTAAATRTVRWGTASLSGTAAVVVLPPADRTDTEPGTLLTLTAALQGGATADTWTWRQISGLPVTITGNGATITVTAPFPMPTPSGGTPADATIVLGVRATVAGTTSTERQITIATLPFVGPWFYNAPDTPTWKPTPIIID